MVHSNIDEVFKYIPKRVFPSDYGGDAPSIKKLTGKLNIQFQKKKKKNSSHFQLKIKLINISEEWTRKVIDRRDWFIEDSQYYVTESKRPGKQINGMQLFGCDGSFKQLEFD